MSQDIRDTLEYTRRARNRYRTFSDNINKLHFSRYVRDRKAASRRRSENDRDLIHDMFVSDDTLPAVRVTITGLKDANRSDEDKRRYVIFLAFLTSINTFTNGLLPTNKTLARILFELS